MRTIVFLVVILFFSPVRSSQAEIKATVDVNRDSAASDAFKFAKASSPSRTDAANAARFTILSGRRDRNGGDVGRLNDGRWPKEDDEPGANFFFAAGTPGGRLLVDLGSVVEIKQINTYSWHGGTRGPQVYKLFAGDFDPKKFDAASTKKGDGAKKEDAAKQDDPVKDGWKLLANVDTRAKDQPAGGQYAVSIADTTGGAIGKYRYLLLDISRTESDDNFGNTFFGEIDVIDGKEHAPASPPPAATVKGEPDVLKVGDKYEIVFDTSQMPEIKEWVDKKLKPVCATWYPKIVELLPSERFVAPKRFTIIFHKEMRGVANTAGGARINCAGPWFMRNLEGEAVGAVVHELVHVVQQYRGVRGGSRNPGWMVEGVADYIRWFLYEPEDKRPRPNAERARYTDSYRTTAAFLNYCVEKHDKEIVKKFNAAMRAGQYNEDKWKEFTGKTVDELWADYVKTLKK